MSTINTPIAGSNAASSTTKTNDYRIEVTDGPVAMNAPQKMGTLLWLPMTAMAVMGFAAALVVAGIRSNLVGGASPADAATIESLRHLAPGFMFVGFTGVFTAISFAVARILGVFRVGGSQVQDDIGKGVHTLKMPTSAKAFLATMMMGMMAVLAGAVVHLVVGFGLADSLTEEELLNSERWFLFSEGIRRIGVGLYLVGITLGLTTIVQVLRFQSIRIRQLV